MALSNDKHREATRAARQMVEGITDAVLDSITADTVQTFARGGLVQLTKLGDVDFSTGQANVFVQVAVGAIQDRKRRLAEQRKPVWDGTRECCRTDQDFWALHQVFEDLKSEYEKLDREARRVEDTMRRLRSNLERVLQPSGKTGRFDSATEFTSVKQAVHYNGINSCGELQSCDIDLRCGVLEAKREAALNLVHVLGYRLADEE